MIDKLACQNRYDTEQDITKQNLDTVTFGMSEK